MQARGLPWFTDVFAALSRGEADYAVLPIENSSTGSIRQVYDLMAQYDCYVVGEYDVEVRHCLMALPGVRMEDIQTVYSHEQGLMQSDKFLESHRTGGRCPRWTPPAPPGRLPGRGTGRQRPSAPSGRRSSMACRFW